MTASELGSLVSNFVEHGGLVAMLVVVAIVPAGLNVTLATRRVRAAAVGLIALAVVIELLQGVFGLGAPDPGDLVANSLGALVGAGVGATGLGVVAHKARSDHARSPRVLVLSVFAGSVILALVWLGLAAAADTRRAGLANDVTAALGSLTAADNAAEFATSDGTTRLFSATDRFPDYLGQVGDTGVYAARYSTEFLGFDRCVFARWDTDGLSLINGSGKECTVSRDRPPN